MRMIALFGESGTLSDAKAVLFVRNDQSKLLKAHILL